MNRKLLIVSLLLSMQNALAQTSSPTPTATSVPSTKRTPSPTASPSPSQRATPFGGRMLSFPTDLARFAQEREIPVGGTSPSPTASPVVVPTSSGSPTPSPIASPTSSPSSDYEVMTMVSTFAGHTVVIPDGLQLTATIPNGSLPYLYSEEVIPPLTCAAVDEQATTSSEPSLLQKPKMDSTWIRGARGGGCAVFSIAACNRLIGRTAKSADLTKDEWNGIAESIGGEGNHSYDKVMKYYTDRGYCATMYRFRGKVNGKDDIADIETALKNGCDVKLLWARLGTSTTRPKAHIETVTSTNAKQGLIYTNSWGETNVNLETKEGLINDTHPDFQPSPDVAVQVIAACPCKTIPKEDWHPWSTPECSPPKISCSASGKTACCETDRRCGVTEHGGPACIPCGDGEHSCGPFCCRNDESCNPQGGAKNGSDSLGRCVPGIR